MSDERKIGQLMEEAELSIGAGNHKEAEHRLFQALERAIQTRSLTLIDEITNLFGKIGLAVSLSKGYRGSTLDLKMRFLRGRLTEYLRHS